MKKKSLLIMLLVALFVPLAMNAQNKTLKKSTDASAKPKLEVKLTDKAMTSNPLISKFESAKEAAFEELNNREGTRGTTTVTASRITAANSTWTGTGGESWNVAITISNTSGLNQAVTNGYAQFGTRQQYATRAVFSTSGISGTITAIDVDCASYNGQGNVSVTVGGAAFGSSQTIPSWTGSAGGTRNFTGSASGAIAVTMTNGTTTHRAMYIKSITVTYQDAGCSAPEDFAASNVTTSSVTLSWTETGTSEEWAILYMSDEDTEAQVEFADTNPYTLTGLNPATYYIAEVIPMCGDYDQESDVIEFTTEDLPCPRPTDLSVSDITMSSATVSWEGEADSYTLQYRVPANNGEAALFQDFESGGFDDWTTIRNGGGTTNTDWRVINPETAFSSGGSPAHSGSYVAMSRSWASSAYTVDNWLISPQFTLGGTLRYWVMDDGEYHETYYICVSTGGNTVRDFTQIYAPGNATDSWTEVTVDLSAYEGRQGYIAFHHADTDQDYLFIDDIGVYGESQPAGPWITVNNVTSPYTITGLQGETAYEWQIQGDCGAEGASLVAYGENFTTASACDAPVALTATNVTNSSATISWAGNTDTYNIQYGAVDPDAPVTVILTADDVWGDGSGYQMLLDANATAYGTTIPETGPLTTSGDASSAVYAEFEYKIPVRADGALTTSNIVSNGASVSIEIPAGTYDWCITNPTPGDRMWIAADAGNVGGRQDDYVFQPGKTYEFYVHLSGTGDATDVTITSNAEMTVVNNVTSPYTLTNLTMNTTYEVQVQGVNCDGHGSTTDWSSSTSFTTLNGTLVESIEADDVTVTIGETASITNLEVLPADATNPAVTYTSNDEAIATVTDAGVVTGVAVGETTITIAAIDGSGVSYDITVTVNGIDVTSITASDVTVVTSETATITYTVAPENATDPSVTFASADETIATVDASGAVTGVAVGETTITITSVSNPEVSAEITVTVTSNPNAVQFTVNAPANAAPGDVITVEGVLTGPANGTWDGFTNLALGIYYDAEAFEFVPNSMVYGPVVTQAQQYNAMLMANTSNPGSLILGINCYQYGYFVTAEGVVFSAQFTVLAEAGEYEFTAQPNFYYNFDHEGVFITYEATPSTVEVSMLETYTKEIKGYGDSDGGYYLIASPIGEVDPEEVTNMLVNDYDLYYFDQTHELEWINYKSSEFNLMPGKGYLYANSDDVTLTFTGRAYNGDGVVELNYEASATFAGWNLVGNPFATNDAYIADGRPFYTMSTDGGEIIPATTKSIAPMEGVFVIAEEEGETLTFTTEDPNSKSAQLVINATSNRNSVIDRAIVRFDESNGLPKFQLNPNHTKLYIPMDNKDYAVVKAAEMGEMPVSFKAEKNGNYTLSFSNQEVMFNYLHLIDNLTGNDVDLLENPSYSFDTRTTDNTSRFKLVFSVNNNGVDDDFAFISNNHLMILGLEGQAILKVMDVTGRTLSTETFNGNYDKAVNMTSGIYMLQLIQGSNVKTQKIVVK